MGSATSRDRLMKLLEPVVGAEGLDLEDVTVTPAGKRRLLRVVVDRDGGVSLDDVAEVSLAVSAALDADDAMGSAPYVLEVSSPGVDRPLTEPRHWRRATKRLVKADLRDGTSLEGRIVATDGTGVELDVEGVAHRVDYQDLTRGRVQVEFRRLDETDDDGEDAGDDGDDGDEG
ncbi:ribosome maturation factor RimP [Planobispora longispora]|uniref:Ribosome maturation factor RimP n=1 Tax=Planobispora longispora TaxID=28887 RepID=A0A8J3RSZ7_9ACTN|nr:ribosome maturation factor RimP [Planobispora longispora]BFE87748.1 ribosome maturation factor RimP [Planobispora longispora]GIH77713.1 ribosome maturation factor RimP [Planobispora longispora]